MFTQISIYIVPTALVITYCIFLIFLIFFATSNLGFFLEERPIVTKKDFKTKLPSLVNTSSSSSSDPKENEEDKKKRLKKELEEKKDAVLRKHLATGCLICFFVAALL